uniref:Uncharacterized protein n=1 Tax=Strongyloides venezuelensis TaxID=75913 RepID=A0A0K0FSZ7_STRVS
MCYDSAKLVVAILYARFSDFGDYINFPKYRKNYIINKLFHIKPSFDRINDVVKMIEKEDEEINYRDKTTSDLLYEFLNKHILKNYLKH